MDFRIDCASPQHLFRDFHTLDAAFRTFVVKRRTAVKQSEVLIRSITLFMFVFHLKWSLPLPHRLDAQLLSSVSKREYKRLTIEVSHDKYVLVFMNAR